MSRLELKVPPDVVWLAVALLMWLGDPLFADLAIPGLVRGSLAVALYAAGIALIVLARVELDRAHTTWHPTTPGRTTALVTSGVFRLSRNPTYLGMWLVLAGWSVALADPVTLLLSALFVLYIHRLQVLPEERSLTATMGDDYREYTKRVRRWL